MMESANSGLIGNAALSSSAERSIPTNGTRQAGTRLPDGPGQRLINGAKLILENVSVENQALHNAIDRLSGSVPQPSEKSSPPNRNLSVGGWMGEMEDILTQMYRQYEILQAARQRLDELV